MISTSRLLDRFCLLPREHWRYPRGPGDHEPLGSSVEADIIPRTSRRSSPVALISNGTSPKTAFRTHVGSLSCADRPPFIDPSRLTN